MKKTYLYLVIVIIILNSCKSEFDIYSLTIHMQASFEQDSVQVFIDDQEIFNDIFQTDHRIGLCYSNGQSNIDIPHGKHIIKIIINNSLSKSEKFSMKRDSYLGVNYHPITNEISIIYSQTPFMYD